MPNANEEREREVTTETIRLTIDVDKAVCEALDKVKAQLGLRSRGSVINQLLKELLTSE